MASALLESLRKSIGKKKNKSQAFAWLADLERESGDLQTSLERVDGGLTLYPNDIAAKLVRSLILFQKNEFEACIEECNNVLKLDPFCLSAQKRMGDAYEKLGNENERNKCYRRVHDMDPLDTFWKEEYDHVENLEDIPNVSMADEEFSMPEDIIETNEATLEKSADTVLTEFQVESSLQNDNSQEVTSMNNALEETLDEEDPFAAFASLTDAVDSGEDAAMESLQSSLDSAMQELSDSNSSLPEVFPVDEEVSGNDVGSAFSSLFGDEDDLEPEAPASPFAKLDLPSSIEESEFSSSNFDKALEEEKPQSVDSAFNDIFGEDELPEEKLEQTLEEEKPQSVDSAFNDIFGEDELPIEKSQNSLDEDLSIVNNSSVFEKSLENPLFEKSSEENTLTENATRVSESSESLFEKSSDDFQLNNEESTLEQFSNDSLFDKSSDLHEDLSIGTLIEDSKLDETAPIIEGNSSEFDSMETTSSESENDGESFNVDSAFDSLFGSETNDDTLDNLKKESTTEREISVEDNSEVQNEENTLSEVDSFAKEMGGAFSDIFGNESDDLENIEDPIEESLALSGSEQENTSALIEESLLKEVNIEDDINKSFSNIFGEDELPEEFASTDKAVQSNTEVETITEPIKEESIPSVELNSLENAIDGAFKGLFETEDDAFIEDTQSSKGVDFLMSNDSNEDVSNGLIKNPSAPLESGAADLDESLNTKTLAEIYYEQGLYGKALDIYEDLARKEPNNPEIMNRLSEIEKAYREKFGGNGNG